MISYLSISLSFLLIIFVVSVKSACFQGQVKSQVTKYGTVDTQCAFNDMKVLPGSSFKLPMPDCIECKCTTKSMICCGFGFAAGIVEPPSGCVAYNDACKLIFVKKNNSTEVCATAKASGTKKKKFRPHVE
uniref:Metal binding protein n=1 Tax=Adineta vaga TaxID=104782 RepID=B3G3Z8_ADIVA|nr:metal binding protein [Adineta vaga]